MADAGSGTAFDLVEQAGAVTVFEYAVFAGAQQENFLQNLNAVAHGVTVGVGAEVLVGFLQAAAVVGHLREGMAGKHEIGVGLVVAEQDIVFRRQGLDEVVFENQRFCFGAGYRDFDVGNLPHHQGDTRR